MVDIKKLPPGEAIGARDLQTWSGRRLAGRSGVYQKQKRKRAKKRKRAIASLREEVRIVVTCWSCDRAVKIVCRMQDFSKLKCSACGHTNPKIAVM